MRVAATSAGRHCSHPAYPHVYGLDPKGGFCIPELWSCPYRCSYLRLKGGPLGPYMDKLFIYRQAVYRMNWTHG